MERLALSTGVGASSLCHRHPLAIKQLLDRSRLNRKLLCRLSNICADARIGVRFPMDYSELLEQVKVATQAALKDSKTLLEIEFPTSGLDSVSGDAEGGIEMNMSMVMVRDFCSRSLPKELFPYTRIFFPDINEVDSAKRNVFENTTIKLDYLTKPSILQDFGFGKKLKIADRVRPTDKIFVIAYPYFNVNEMLAVEELYKDAAAESGRPVIIFNGELDRIRSGYYPSLFYPKLAALSQNFLPKFETIYYIHNFKGRVGGTLYRAYPGPWQILRKMNNKHICLLQRETMPSLKEVALEILPYS